MLNLNLFRKGLNSLESVSILAAICTFSSITFSHAQQSVGIGTNTPNPNAVLQLVSPGQNQGFLLPKLTTTQINLLGLTLVNTDKGLQVYDSLLQQIRYWDGSSWLTLSTSVASGTVTSVGLSLPAIFNVSGSPVTTSGVLSASFLNQAQNTVFAGPTVGSASPTFRTLVAGDIPSLPATIITSGTLPIARGGTNGTAVPTAGAVAYGTGTAYAFTSAGTSGQVLQSNGAAPPTWVTLPAAGWGLTGNAGTNPLTNFIGTTDAQPLRFATGVGGVERMRIIPSGNVGIGTITPVARLEVQTNNPVSPNTAVRGSAQGTASQVFGIYGDASTLVGAIGYGVYGFASGTGTNWSIYSDGHLNLQGGLAVGAGNNFGTAGQVLTSAGAGAAPTWENAGGSGWSLTGNSGTNPLTNFIGTTDAQDFRVRTNNLERFAIASTGNVGIGTSTPLSRLQLGSRMSFFTDPTSPQEIMTRNIYNDGTDFRYILAGGATAITMGDNRLGMFIFPAGSANGIAGSPIGRFNFTTTGLVINGDSPNDVLDVRGPVYINSYAVPPGTVADRLYNVGGSLFWNGTNISGAGFNTLNSIPRGNGTGLVPSSITDNGSVVTLTSADMGADIFRVVNTASSANINIQGTAAGGSLIRLSAGLLQTFVWSGSGNLFMDANAGTLHLQTSATDRLFINNTGNIGIGNSSPTQRLDITGNLRLSGAFMPNNQAGTAGQVLTSAGPGVAPTWENVGGSGWSLTGNAGTNPLTNFIGTTDAQPLRFATGVGGVERMRIDATGNFGIGTITPVTRLHVSSNGNVARLQGVDHAYLEYYADGPSTRTGYMGYASPTDNNFSIGNDIGDIQLAPISGRVGIGGGAFPPVTPLHVSSVSQTRVIMASGNLTDVGLLLDNTSPGGRAYTLLSSGTGSTVGVGNFNIIDDDAGLSRLSINSAGNIGMGILTPDQRLVVNGNIRITDADIFLRLSPDQNHGVGWYGGAKTFNGVSVDGPVLYGFQGGGLGTNQSGTRNLALNWNSTGNVGIGTTSPGGDRLRLVDAGNSNQNSGTFSVFANNLTQGVGIGYAGIQAVGSNANQDLSLNSKGTGNITMQVSGTTGNVGIGTSAPNARLSVGLLGGTAASTSFSTNAGVLGTGALNELPLASIGFNSGNQSSFSIRAIRQAAGTDWTTTAILLGMDVDNTVRAGGALLAISNNGNIGIGTGAPTENLTVQGGVNIDNGSLNNGTVANSLRFGFGASGEAIASKRTGGGNAVGLDFYTNSVARMSITNGGNVGIGTNNPLGRLHVENSDYGTNSMILTSNAGSAGSTIRFTNAAREYALIGSTGTGASTGAGSFALFDNTGGAYRFVVSPSGNFGINTLSPVHTLDVFGDERITGSLGVGASPTGDDDIFVSRFTSSIVPSSFSGSSIGLQSGTTSLGSTKWAMEATTGGLIVFGTQSLSGRLWFSKNDAAVAVMDNLYFAPYANAGMDLGTNDFRWNRLFYTSGILGTSDKRLKNNIQPLHYGLSELMKLNPVRFSWNLFPEQGVQLGLIAQEVQHILPEVISIGTDSIKTLSLNHLQLIPVLIKATQELNTKVDKLESENVGLIHSFKEELAELKKRHETEIATLKKQMEQVLQHQSTQARRPE